MLSIANVVLTASLISFTAWLARTQPRLAGFLLSLPLSSLIADSIAREVGAEGEGRGARSLAQVAAY